MQKEIRTLASDVNIAGESSLLAREDLETANAKVITLQKELSNLNKKNDWLGTEISRLQNIEKKGVSGRGAEERN